MNRLDQRIGIAGAGNMGEAMVGAMIRADLVRPENIRISDIRPERLEQLKKTWGIGTTEDSRTLFRDCDVVILAVKPQQIDALLESVPVADRSGDARKLIISIAAGVRLERIEQRLYAGLDADAKKRLPVVRVMPNTPALVLAGMAGLSPNANATAEDIGIARAIFQAMGKAEQFEEADLDAVTAVSGSGPAYVFYLAESMIAGGKAAGLTHEAAAALTQATLEGAVKLMAAAPEPPEELRRRVTSPGGTTEAAVGVLDGGQVRERIVEAIVAAARRARELSG